MKLLLISTALLSVLGCQRQPVTHGSGPSRQSGQAGGARAFSQRATGTSRLARSGAGTLTGPLHSAMNALVTNCPIAHWGYARRGSCANPELMKTLDALERQMGPKRALLTYCRHLADPKRDLRLLASFRISRMNNYRQMQLAADVRSFACLREHLAAERTDIEVSRLARSVALMGTALNRDAEVLEAIDHHPMRSAKIAGYGAIWANGRARVLPTLERVVQGDGDVAVRQAVIAGFADGKRLNGAEAHVVCSLLALLMASEAPELAVSAAHGLATACEGSAKRVVDAVRAMNHRGVYHRVQVNALSAAAGHFDHRAPRKQMRRILGVLARIVNSNKADALTRSTALLTIYRLDPKRARGLARKHRKDRAPMMRRAVERIAPPQTR